LKKFHDKIIRVIDRAISGTIGRQLLFFSGLTIVVFICLFAASALLYPVDSGGVRSSADGRFWNMVLNFIDVGGFDDTAGTGRVLILIANLFGMVIFGGILVSVLTNIIERRIDRVKDGGVFYKWNNHTIIFGYDPICGGLVKNLAKQGEIVLQTTRDVSAVRHELFNNLTEDTAKNVTIVNCTRTSRDDLEKLRIPRCSQIFCLGEEDESDRDSKNIECLQALNAILAETEKHVRAFVLFSRQSSFAAFQQQDIPDIREHIDFVPFNFCDLWAQKVFAGLSYNSGEINYTPLDHEPITEDSLKRVHLVILGMTDMGIALGIEAAQLCHFPNFVTQGIKTRVTFIDENADREMDFLKGRLSSFFDEIDYYYFDKSRNTANEIDPSSGGEPRPSASADASGAREKYTDVEFEFIKSRFEQDEVRRYLVQAASRSDTFLTVAAACADQSEALACALYLPREVYDSGAQVLVRQESYAIVSMLAGDGGFSEYRKYKNLKPFGMTDNAWEEKMADNILPMMVKYTYDNTSDESVITEFPEEEIRRNWIENWRPSDNVSALKASNRYCANFIAVKQRSLGIKAGLELNPRQINLAARIEHNRWVTEKLLVGFRAPTVEEAAAIAADKKREYYKARLIHEDLKAYDVLGNDDKNIDVKVYDINISRALPYMVKAYEEAARKAKG
jgi:hypothetical protein